MGIKDNEKLAKRVRSASFLVAVGMVVGSLAGFLFTPPHQNDGGMTSQKIFTTIIRFQVGTRRRVTDLLVLRHTRTMMMIVMTTMDIIIITLLATTTTTITKKKKKKKKETTITRVMTTWSRNRKLP